MKLKNGMTELYSIKMSDDCKDRLLKKSNGEYVIALGCKVNGEEVEWNQGKYLGEITEKEAIKDFDIYEAVKLLSKYDPNELFANKLVDDYFVNTIVGVGYLRDVENRLDGGLRDSIDVPKLAFDITETYTQYRLEFGTKTLDDLTDTICRYINNGKISANEIYEENFSVLKVIGWEDEEC